MKALIRVLGWLLLVAGVAGVVGGVVLLLTDRVSGGLLTTAYIVGIPILAIIIGSAMTRVGRRRHGSYADQWTRKGPPT